LRICKPDCSGRSTPTDLAEARRLNDRIQPVASVFYADPFVDMDKRMKEALVLLGRMPRAVVRPALVKIVIRRSRAFAGHWWRQACSIGPESGLRRLADEAIDASVALHMWDPKYRNSSR
jgi:hypothetical protein